MTEKAIENAPRPAGHHQDCAVMACCDHCGCAVVRCHRYQSEDLTPCCKHCTCGTPRPVECDCERRTSDVIEKLRAVLQATRDELNRWGHGDMHYGSMPQNARVVAAVELADRTLKETLDA